MGRKGTSGYGQQSVKEDQLLLIMQRQRIDTSALSLNPRGFKANQRVLIIALRQERIDVIIDCRCRSPYSGTFWLAWLSRVRFTEKGR